MRAVAKANPIRPRNTNSRVANLPKWAKPDIDGEATSTSSHRTCRGDWGRRVSKDRSGTWETRPCGWNPTRAGKHNRDAAGRESAGSIVVMKRGNSRGAKGPYRSHADVRERKCRFG